MACNVFIQISGLEGESSDDRHCGWLEVTQYDFNVRQKVSRTAGSAGGASAERADFSQFGFTKLMDKTSPLLAVACAAGTRFDTIVVELCRAGGEKFRFMRYTFTNCVISAFHTSSDGDFPEDDVSFAYGKVDWCYTLQNRATGWAAGNVACVWSLEKNCTA
jgi:type VI secretion system secreted protein Hcp